MVARDAIPQASELVSRASELMHSELASKCERRLERYSPITASFVKLSKLWSEDRENGSTGHEEIDR